MSLNENLKEFMNNLLSFKRKGLKNNPHVKLLTYDIKNDIKSIVDNIDISFIVDASVGKGTWADIPWISIRNQTLAPSMGKGIYPVFLFNSDGSGFYLSLNQGVLSASQKINKLQQQKYKENTETILKNIPELMDWEDNIDGIDLKANTPLGKNYEFANISAKYYSINDIPADQQIEEDLSELLKLYSRIDKSIISTSDDSVKIVNNHQNSSINNQPLNQILYGPPGTGKTYITVEKAVAICDPELYIDLDDKNYDEKRNALKERYDELVQSKQISFITFHQSFNYEDFIEGIRAITNDNKQIEYSIEDGIFKEICQLASVKENTNLLEGIHDLKDREVWKMSLGDTSNDSESSIYDECLENNYVLLGYGYALDYSTCNSMKKVEQKVLAEIPNSTKNDFVITAINRLRNGMKKGDLIVITDGNRKFRAIAEITGDYFLLPHEERNSYRQARPVKWLRIFDTSIPVSAISTVNFSQMSIYKFYTHKLKLDQLLEYVVPKQSIRNTKKNYVIIIDEINRGNISSIFGELITLLEESKRQGNDDERSVTLPYSKEKFSIPNNLYVIGTMNTSDHSLTKLDLALRRRFEFVELLPNYDLLNGLEVHGINIGKMLKIMNDRIEILLGRDYLIGHSYLLPLLKNIDEDEQTEKLAEIFKNKIIPLLQEYFFEDWERIQWILNDQNKDPEDQFIHLLNNTKQNDLASLFQNVSELNQLSDRRYQINEDAFIKPEAYQKILSE